MLFWVMLPVEMKERQGKNKWPNKAGQGKQGRVKRDKAKIIPPQIQHRGASRMLQ
jgi:hypothetical protein